MLPLLCVCALLRNNREIVYRFSNLNKCLKHWKLLCSLERRKRHGLDLDSPSPHFDTSVLLRFNKICLIAEEEYVEQQDKAKILALHTVLTHPAVTITHSF